MSYVRKHPYITTIAAESQISTLSPDSELQLSFDLHM